MSERDAAVFGRWIFKTLGYSACAVVCSMATWAAFDHLLIGWAVLFALAAIVLLAFLCSLIGIAVDGDPLS